MSPDQIQLLRALGSGVRPVDLGEGTLVNSDRFGTMLHEAVQGRARTELGVTFAPNASGMFDSIQQDRIARAIDLAAAAGSDHALILHERHSLRVDVRNRVVLEAPETEDMRTITGIDTFVSAQVPAQEEDGLISQPSGRSGRSPARIVRNASLMRTLADAQPMHDS